MIDFTGSWKPWQAELAEKHSLTCPPGWYGFACGEGWKALLDEAFTKLKAAGWDGEIHQIKEKFGTLRMYVSRDGAPEFRPIIQEAEEKSAKTCEQCGEPGKLRAGGWWHTLCDACEEAYLAERRKDEQGE